jgi:hypothetical protein
VGTLPVEDSDEQKRTNEIGMAIPLLKTCVIEGKDITGDALLTQRAIANYVIEQGAHYHFTVKGNPSRSWNAISLCCSKPVARRISSKPPPSRMAASKPAASGAARH